MHIKLLGVGNINNYHESAFWGTNFKIFVCVCVYSYHCNASVQYF